MSDSRPEKKGELPKYMGALGDVRTGYELETESLADYLAGLPGVDPSGLRIRQYSGGQSNPTYLLETDAAKYVLRRRPPGKLLASAHAVDREYRVMKALGELGIPVPEMLGYCEDASVLGTAFFVMRHVNGRIFSDNRMPDLSRQERAAAYDSANETLARLHSIDPAAVGLADFGRPGNYFERQVSRWSKQYLASKTDDIPEMEQLMEWLVAHVPPEVPPRVVHGDYSFHNLIFHPERPQVVAILDWELSTTGDPVADLSYHALEWYRPVGIDPRGSLQDADLDALGIPSLEDYVARYCGRVGRPTIENFGFYKAFNLFRIAAILQGIVGRTREGTAVDPSAAETEQRVRPMAQAGWAEAQKL